MVKCTFTFGFLAATLAATVAGHQSDVKIFTPKLPNRSNFNIYKDAVSVSSPIAPASFIGPASKNNAVQDNVNIATAYLAKNHKIPVENIKITDAYTDKATGVTHVYARQTIHGTDVVNAVANINISKDGKVISSSQSFAPASAVSKIKRSTGSLSTRANANASLKSALKSMTDYVKTGVNATTLNSVQISSSSSLASGELEFSISGLPKDAAVDSTASAKKSYIQLADGSLKSVWSIVLKQDENWYHGHVNAETNKVESINNWVSNAESYNVLPRTVNSPEAGQRQVVTNPANPKASPRGWVSSGTTVGNNVWAQNNPSGGRNWRNNYRPRARAGNVFNYPMNLYQNPSSYVDASITQLFYTVNVMHDLSYLYGFDEAAGNFQDTNYSGRGRGNDAVVAFTQDGSGTNNANFATPPDGYNGVMRMYVWTRSNPYRDSSLDQDIVAHEFTHGISNRLTGGPANSDCLNDGEAGGMGEGWSDTVANLMRIKPGDTRNTNLVMGRYSLGGRGIRNYPYSTSTSVNPTTYRYLDDRRYQEVHAIGEVWAEMLYEVIWNIIDNNGGKIGDLFNRDLTTGNAIALQIILDGMKLQPCNPNFIAARNAIIQAEQHLTGGRNKCAIWRGFAKRGLGAGASSDGWYHREDYRVPGGC
ncbi:hypothetical protein GGI12_001792 [Dipsacomyces acuminosporus]|nr:hypothetical protein GGI12_001792 [Dipsacomyces acuminosporus]